METLITIIHIIVSLFLIFVVLLQQGKGAGMGAVFGGAGQAVFGPRSEGNVMSKVTAITALIFMLTSMSLVRFATSGESMVKERVQQSQAAGAIDGAEPGADLSAEPVEPSPDDGTSSDLDDGAPE